MFWLSTLLIIIVYFYEIQQGLSTILYTCAINTTCCFWRFSLRSSVSHILSVKCIKLAFLHIDPSTHDGEEYKSEGIYLEPNLSDDLEMPVRKSLFFTGHYYFCASELFGLLSVAFFHMFYLFNLFYSLKQISLPYFICANDVLYRLPWKCQDWSDGSYEGA